MKRARLIRGLLLAAALTACGAPQATPSAPEATRDASPGPSASPSQVPTANASVQPSPSASTTSTPTDARTVGWRSDLALLVPEMDACHPQLDHGVSIEELDAAVSQLSAQVPSTTDDELMVGVLRIVAMVSADGCDAHTGAYVWGNGTYPLDSMPLRLWLFDEGVYIVDALPPYENLIGARVDGLASRAMDEVLQVIDPIVPRDNDQTVALLMPRFLLIPQVLRGLGLLIDDGPIALAIVDAQGNSSDVAIEPIAMADYNSWAGGYGLHLPTDPGVPYVSRIGEALWVDGPDADGTVFVQYNRVEFIGLSEVTAALADPATKRVVLDVRHNYGGEVSALDPVIDDFTAYAASHPGTLYLVTGRNTFSAGSLLVARFDAQTDAVIVGEPMGGCPTAWGDDEGFDLPYSGISVTASTFFEIGVDPEDARLTVQPDLPARLTPTGWAAGVDPALDAIRATNP